MGIFSKNSYDDDSKRKKMVALELISIHFPSIGSDDPPPPPPLGVENVKSRENSEKIENIDKFAEKESAFGWIR